MQEMEAPVDPSESALQVVMPALRKATKMGWIIIAVIAMVTIALMIFVASVAEEAAQWLIGLPIFGIFAMAYAGSWVRTRHESDIMPILSQAFGLGYIKAPKNYFGMLPANFVPRGGRQHCDDLLSGTIAERRYQFLEVKTETGGKNSRVLFNGVVVEVATRAALPRFLIAPVVETQGILFFKGRVGVDEKVQMFTVPGPNGQDYGLWMDEGNQGKAAALRPFMEKMLDLGGSLVGGSLYSVACTGNTIFVAIRNKTNLFQIGGLLATEAAIMLDIRRASEQFAMPLRLATNVMRAEDALLIAMGNEPQHPHLPTIP